MANFYVRSTDGSDADNSISPLSISPAREPLFTERTSLSTQSSRNVRRPSRLQVPSVSVPFPSTCPIRHRSTLCSSRTTTTTTSTSPRCDVSPRWYSAACASSSRWVSRRGLRSRFVPTCAQGVPSAIPGHLSMADDPPDEPPRLLARERERAGLTREDFDVLAIGETRGLR